MFVESNPPAIFETLPSVSDKLAGVACETRWSEATAAPAREAIAVHGRVDSLASARGRVAFGYSRRRSRKCRSTPPMQ